MATDSGVSCPSWYGGNDARLTYGKLLQRLAGSFVWILQKVSHSLPLVDGCLSIMGLPCWRDSGVVGQFRLDRLVCNT